MYLGQGENFNLTNELTGKIAISPQPDNQKRLK